jgi:uncharacterized protein YndB with AHSA1/START domain
MIVKILIPLAAIAAGLAVLVARQPSTFRIARTAVISAPPDQVFAQVNDLHAWEAWSPWLKADPAARTAYEGPRTGTGAAFTWAGNRHVGEGSMTITESRPGELIRLRLDFRRPFASTSTAAFTFEPQGDRILVTWTMSGENTLVARLLHLFVDMDAMIGGKFDEGLTQLKAIAEGAARA